MFRKLLIPLDGSSLAERVLPAAAALAAKTSVPLTLLHVLEKRAKAQIHADRHLTAADEAESYLRQLASRLSPDLQVDWHVHMDRVGDVARSIVEHADEVGAGLIAITTHGAGGLSRILFGSIAEQVLTRCGRPVLLSPVQYAGPTDVFPCRQILVPVDIGPGHDQGPELGLRLAAACGAALTLVAVAPTFTSLEGRRTTAAQLQPAATLALLEIEAEQLAEQLRVTEDQARQLGVAVAALLLRGHPAECLLRAIADAHPDLVVFASHARKGVDALLDPGVGQQLCARSRAHLLVLPIAAT
ncbi:MAG: universal stress protein [Planctomycetota bacterium]|nr:universal stress protein [Planctomycetota bacterium]